MTDYEKLIAEMRAKYTGATPGRWKAVHLGTERGKADAKGKSCVVSAGRQTGVVTDHDGGLFPAGDVEFVEACHEHMPTLLAALTASKEESADDREQVAKAMAAMEAIDDDESDARWIPGETAVDALIRLLAASEQAQREAETKYYGACSRAQTLGARLNAAESAAAEMREALNDLESMARSGIEDEGVPELVEFNRGWKEACEEFAPVIANALGAARLCAQDTKEANDG